MSTQDNASVRSFTAFALTVTPVLKQQMLNWANQFNICCFMDNHGYHDKHGSYECLVAAGAWKWVKVNAGNAFGLLNAFAFQQRDWLFGHFGFDLKQETEQVPSRLPDPLGFPDCYFFVPEHLLLVKGKEVLVSSYSLDTSELMRLVLASPAETTGTTGATQPVELTPAFKREEYVSRINILKAHIHRGDCYEINFCQEFFAGEVRINPVAVYQRLAAISPNPFSVYYRINELYLACASPERFLKIESGRVWSQPIKGTAARNLQDPAEDTRLAEGLVSSLKERSENVMVVDLVRNDLSRICKAGTVEVEELFGVYSFPQVHQMISTVTGLLADGLNWVDAVKACFPMGSMTGAPKKRVLELIEQYELVRRGIFSGAVGYVSPTGDADFNVVIRSIMYNESKKYLNCLVGSGITWYADAALEYEECLLKAAAIREALGS
ncbi:anthranilate synthase component I family protein [Flavihumibacter stibioxidans]|nr:anthranilate synthase component I family protein [Flavihumibacter stibioxidans]